MINRLYFALFVLLLICCHTKSNNRVVVAKVLDKYLYLDQIPSFQSKAINSKDSILFLHNIANNWAINKLLINKAEFNLKLNSFHIDSLVEIYRESLLIHHYKEALIQTYLDTVIEDSLIINYYNSNINNFKLQEDIVRLKFIKIRNVAPNLEFVSASYSSNDNEVLDDLEDYCLQFADRFFLDAVDWISWEKFSKQLPVKSHEFLSNKFLFQKNQKIEFSDQTYQYFIFIEDFKIKGSASPLEYVSSVVKNILINKRKQDIINSIETKLLEEAIINDDFKIL